MLKLLGLGFNPWVLLAIGIGLAVSHGVAFKKGYSYSSNSWEVAIAEAKEEARREQEARNKETREELEALVRAEETTNKELASKLERLRNVTNKDGDNHNVVVSDELDSVWSETLGLQSP